MKMTSFLTLDIPYLLKRIQEQLYHIEKKWKKASSKQEFVATELKGYIHLQVGRSEDSKILHGLIQPILLNLLIASERVKGNIRLYIKETHIR